ncbi:unnamed protein product [Darwinula stevensoni]|uniref:Protein artemis n=1 Tax=Darwinula stevensoni TaxID=69355 RepID=A0A7R8WYP7_9CRUS|nr:unnamed protein product [Darwinula stevensoni]CAG0879366.1 unnamed protein product [Darwinula stevensoni]
MFDDISSLLPVDHMVGLQDVAFSSRLRALGGQRLLMSVISSYFLLNQERFTHLHPFICPTPVNQRMTYTITHPSLSSPYDVSITFLPAGHCPGSVMVLLEGPDGNVLYTGDFRLSLEDVQAMKALHKLDGKPKTIKTIYIDTTFCSEKAMHFPSRHESADKLAEVIQEWLNLSPWHVHGRDVAQEGQLRCGFRSADGYPIYVRMIKPSVMWFAVRSDMSDITSVSEDSSFVRLCYPTHSSCSEILDLIKYLKPMQAVPNVIPFGSSKEKVLELLNSFLQRERQRKGSESSSEELSFKSIHLEESQLSGVGMVPLDSCRSQEGPSTYGEVNPLLQSTAHRLREEEEGCSSSDWLLRKSMRTRRRIFEETADEPASLKRKRKNPEEDKMLRSLNNVSSEEEGERPRDVQLKTVPKESSKYPSTHIYKLGRISNPEVERTPSQVEERSSSQEAERTSSQETERTSSQETGRTSSQDTEEYSWSHFLPKIEDETSTPDIPLGPPTVMKEDKVLLEKSQNKAGMEWQEFHPRSPSMPCAEVKEQEEAEGNMDKEENIRPEQRSIIGTAYSGSVLFNSSPPAPPKVTYESQLQLGVSGSQKNSSLSNKPQHMFDIIDIFCSPVKSDPGSNTSSQESNTSIQHSSHESSQRSEISTVQSIHASSQESHVSEVQPMKESSQECLGSPVESTQDGGNLTQSAHFTNGNLVSDKASLETLLVSSHQLTADCLIQRESILACMKEQVQEPTTIEERDSSSAYPREKSPDVIFCRSSTSWLSAKLCASSTVFNGKGEIQGNAYDIRQR